MAFSTGWPSFHVISLLTWLSFGVYLHLPVLPVGTNETPALTYVFQQLVSNALKYTPDNGTISITGTTLPVSSELPDGGIEIVVSDTGIGIDANQLELIFTKFHQTGEVAVHSSGRTKFKGGGPSLGLPIARGMIQTHRGRLWAETPVMMK